MKKWIVRFFCKVLRRHEREKMELSGVRFHQYYSRGGGYMAICKKCGRGVYFGNKK